MAIIGIARVPGITTLDCEDTHTITVPRDLTRGLINRSTPASRQTQVCPAWCVAQGQHLADEHPDDRAHYSGGREVFRTLDTTPGRPKPPAWASLVHFANESRARINAFLGADHPVDLTPAEARAYAAALLALAELAEQTGSNR